jgi:hypothetical protein
MEPSFSQRMGLTPVKSFIQVNSMDDHLRTSLWNDLVKYIWKYYVSSQIDFQSFLDDLWIYYFKEPIDGAPTISKSQNHIKVYFSQCQWYDAYNFIEFVANTFPHESASQIFIHACNSTLERELSAYRFVGKKLVPITSEQEIAEIEKALTVTKPFTPHLDRALELLADRKSPDYANSIKESISAVEAICQLITGNKKATLGDGLRQIESKLGGLHTALRNAFNSLYGYASDAQGIRHALLGESDLDVEDAKFMLIACSAFINYLIVKADKAGIDLSHK